MKGYNWGILGIGKIAHKFAEDLALLPNARLPACASRSMERASGFARQHRIPRAFGSYEELAACPDVDIVYIATPHASHAEAALLCLEHGRAVLCEKPIALNPPEAQRMADKARSSGAFLMEALWTRFLPPTLQVLEWLSQGAIGKVQAVKADFGFAAPFDPRSRLFDPALGGGALLDIGIYPAFIALLALGMPRRIRAASSFGPTGVDEDTAMIFEYEHGALAHLHASIRYPTATEAFIYGEQGHIHLHSRWHHTRQLTLTPSTGAPAVLRYDYPGYGYQFEAAEVMRCLDAGLEESPMWPLEKSLELMKVLDDARTAFTAPLLPPTSSSS